MTKDKFLKELETEDLHFMVNKWVLERVPFVFYEKTYEWIRWKNSFSSKILVDSKSIIITGSACTGFSLNPLKNYSDFNVESDIDVAIVSEYYFDVSWFTLRNLGASRYRLQKYQRDSIDDHVNRLIYWGTIGTDKILDLMPYGKQWITVLSEMGNNPILEGREVKIRIYRDFESLNAYYIDNLKKLKTNQIGGIPNEIILKHDA